MTTVRRGQATAFMADTPSLFDQQYAQRLEQIEREARTLAETIGKLPLQWRVEALNRTRVVLHEASPFAHEPVDCVQWVPADRVVANDYNPNAVAPPEMELLAHSIREDGYTQPIVAWSREASAFEVVDGFHRNRVGREVPDVQARVHGYLPLTVINDTRDDRGDRIAATIRHNR